tara:strand:- start:12014 stop:12448 length:435 start_codon:yes stop_codon:yes gene_type:complete
MINYAKHDEEFFGIFKLSNGEEVLGKAVLTEDNGETLVFIQDPVALQIITKEISDNKVAKGIGFTKWMQMSDEDFFIIREKDIVSIASMSKEFVFMYQSFLSDGEEEDGLSNKEDPKRSDGYVGSINDARKLLEKIYKDSSYYH